MKKERIEENEACCYLEETNLRAHNPSKKNGVNRSYTSNIERMVTGEKVTGGRG